MRDFITGGVKKGNNDNTNGGIQPVDPNTNNAIVIDSSHPPNNDAFGKKKKFASVDPVSTLSMDTNSIENQAQIEGAASIISNK